MAVTKEIARHIREFYFGKNWTAVNLTDTLTGVTWEQAVAKVHNLNTIATLVFHINYYLRAASRVLDGHTLNASDKFSFDLPPVSSEDDWQGLVSKTFEEAESFALQIEQLDDNKLFDTFEDPKYGNYFRNLVGISEHNHYHLGQIVLLKKIAASGQV